MWLKIVPSSGNRRGEIRSRYFFKNEGYPYRDLNKIQTPSHIPLNNPQNAREDTVDNFQDTSSYGWKNPTERRHARHGNKNKDTHFLPNLIVCILVAALIT